MITQVQAFQELINSTCTPERDSFINLLFTTLSEKLDRQSSMPSFISPPAVQDNDEKDEGKKEVSIFSLFFLKSITREMDFTSQTEDDSVRKISTIRLTDLADATRDVDSKEILKAKFKIQDLQANNERAQEISLRRAHFQEDVELKKRDWKEDLLSTVSVVCVGAASYARWAILSSTLQTLLKDFLGVDEETAQRTAYSIAACEVLFRTVTETKLHQQQFKGLPSALSLKNLGDFALGRKVVRGIGAVNGFLFALPNLVVGVGALSLLPEWLRISLLVPSVTLDFSVLSSFYGEQYNDIVTGAVTWRKKNIGINFKRAHLNRWANQVKKAIEKFNNDTVDVLYREIMGGL